MEGVEVAAEATLESIFVGALTLEEQEMLDRARAMEGIREEIAVIRVKLVTAIRENPDDLKLMKVGMDILIRAVATQYRLSPKSKEDLADSIAAVINGIGDQLIAPDR